MYSKCTVDDETTENVGVMALAMLVESRMGINCMRLQGVLTRIDLMSNLVLTKLKVTKDL